MHQNNKSNYKTKNIVKTLNYFLLLINIYITY
jgi:hypothetical protein